MSQTFEVYEDNAGEYRWRLRVNGEIMADSGEGYSSKSNAMAAIGRVQRDAGGADMLEFGSPHFEIYKDRAEEWRWRMIAANGRIVADSGEGYSSKSGVRETVNRIKEGAYDAEVVEE